MPVGAIPQTEFTGYATSISRRMHENTYKINYIGNFENLDSSKDSLQNAVTINESECKIYTNGLALPFIAAVETVVRAVFVVLANVLTLGTINFAPCAGENSQYQKFVGKKFDSLCKNLHAFVYDGFTLSAKTIVDSTKAIFTPAPKVKDEGVSNIFIC